MTLKKMARYRFCQLLDQYREVKRNLTTAENKQKFIVLSVQLHAAKAGVPKRLWPLVNKAA